MGGRKHNWYNQTRCKRTTFCAILTLAVLQSQAALGKIYAYLLQLELERSASSLQLARDFCAALDGENVTAIDPSLTKITLPFFAQVRHVFAIYCDLWL